MSLKNALLGFKKQLEDKATDEKIAKMLAEQADILNNRASKDTKSKPKNGKFCYKYRLDQWTCRNEVMDFCWCKVTDSTISKLGARAYDAALDFYDENTKISIGQAAVKGASNYQFVKHSLVPMAINYEISTVNSDSGSALFVLGKPLVIGVHNWGLNNNVNNRGVCLIGEYRRFFLGHVEG